jgi:ATP-dependent Clp protease adapter protein ClpS
METGTIDKTEVDVTTLFGKPHNVILFNDEEHSFDEVVRQVIKAVKCTPEKAFEYVVQAHKNGESVVFTGSKERCEHIDTILSGPPTNLRTDVRPA